MLKISEFSRLTQVPVKTLRYYDDIGLFQPRSVDKFTGYRYYSVEQLPRLNRILALKELGLSLEQIKDMLDEDLSAEQIRGMLKLKRAETLQRLQEEQTRLNYVEAKLRLIEQEGQMSPYEVILKAIPTIPVALRRGVAPTMAQMGATVGALFGEVMGAIQMQKVRPNDNPAEGMITLYPHAEYMETDIHVEAAMGIQGAMQPMGSVEVLTLPAVEAMACVVYQGGFDAIHLAYDAIMHWIDANSYEVDGASREVYLAFQPLKPTENVTEIQFPVKKRNE